MYYEDEHGAERVVRAECADGTVRYFEGEQGAERGIRIECADSTTRARGMPSLLYALSSLTALYGTTTERLVLWCH
jgi:hypothetical protein